MGADRKRRAYRAGRQSARPGRNAAPVFARDQALVNVARGAACPDYVSARWLDDKENKYPLAAGRGIGPAWPSAETAHTICAWHDCVWVDRFTVSRPRTRS